MGVLIDAFVVRMTLVPALMTLLGDRAWWLPRGLARVLPDADIEGEAVQRMLAQRSWRDADELRRDGVHAQDASFAGLDPVTFAVPARAVLLVRGDGADRVCAVLAGRSGDVEGDLAVQGHLLPFERSTLAAHSAHVEIAPPPVDAESVGDYLRGMLRLNGVSRRDLSERTHDAARAFDALLDVVGAPVGTETGPETLVARLGDGGRWALDASVALSSGLPLVVMDLRGRSPQVVAAVLGRLDASATAVFAVDDECAPVTDRIVVSVRVSAAALERSSS